MRKIKSIQKIPYPAPDVVTKVIPAPTEGWDAISPLASMDPKRAPILTNWVPRPGWVELRQGYSEWCDVGATPVETLMVYRANNIEKLFAATVNDIWDVSTEGAPVSAVNGLSSGKWQYTSFTPSGAPTVIQLCNGVDALRQYNGSTWSFPAITGLPGGLTTAAITNISANKRRLWYVLGNGSGAGSTIAAYMPTDAISGPIAGYYDFGALFTKGGYLVAIGDWTLDGGVGPQDYMVFMSSRGQASLYAGTDPSTAASWSLVGTFDLAPPIGKRCMTRIGSDLGLITQQGVLPISQALPFDPSADRSVSITARIQNAMATSGNSYKNNFGWQLISYPGQQLILLNVPISENVQQVQYVMNALTGAWCLFTGWNANCFEIYQDNLYFGGNGGGINLAWDTSLDLDQAIQADMQCAFNYFDDPGRLKRITMVQPLLTVNGILTPSLGIDVDFHLSNNLAPINEFSSDALWGTAIWGTSLWASGANVSSPWLSTEAVGHALAIHMQVAVVPTGTVTLQVNAFNAIMELGGFV